MSTAPNPSEHRVVLQWLAGGLTAFGGIALATGFGSRWTSDGTKYGSEITVAIIVGFACLFVGAVASWALMAPGQRQWLLGLPGSIWDKRPLDIVRRGKPPTIPDSDPADDDRLPPERPEIPEPAPTAAFTFRTSLEDGTARLQLLNSIPSASYRIQVHSVTGLFNGAAINSGTPYDLFWFRTGRSWTDELMKGESDVLSFITILEPWEGEPSHSILGTEINDPLKAALGIQPIRKKLRIQFHKSATEPFTTEIDSDAFTITAFATVFIHTQTASHEPLYVRLDVKSPSFIQTSFTHTMLSYEDFPGI